MNSVCSFVRKQLGVKGRTWHSGRGFFICEAEDITQEELYDVVVAKVERWEEKGLIERKECSDDRIAVVFNDKVGVDRYRSIVVMKAANKLLTFKAKWLVMY